MEFTAIEPRVRKRGIQEYRHEESAMKYRRTYDSLCLSIQSTVIFLDFNQSYNNVSFQCIETTDHYRPGVPYKLLHYPLKSHLEIDFGITDFDYLQEVQLVLNCCTGVHYNGCVDIFINDKPLIIDFNDTSRGMTFKEHNFSIPKHVCNHGPNRIQVQLSENSPGVFWLSDARLTAVFHVNPLG